MLFGYIEDEKCIDLLDENQKVFRRFKNEKDYHEYCSRFDPELLEGLTRRDTVIKWYESNIQLAKLITPILFVIFCIVKG